MADEMTNLFIRDAPADLKAAVVKEGGNMNDSIVQVLADRFQVPFEPTGLHASVPASAGAGDIVLRLPQRLHRTITVEAARRGGTARGLVIATLCHHYELPVPPIGRRRRGSVTQ